ncbi:MAG: hypothetical protein U9N14_00185, partial [Pseudomonadota bacterium]|nr:hypothetical protein [Pseudomonadota bacterium]
MYNPFDPLDPARIPNYDAALRTTKSNVLQISMSTIMMYALDSLFYADFATDCDCRLARKGLREIKAMGGALAATPTDSPVHQTDLDSWMDKLAELR